MNWFEGVFYICIMAILGVISYFVIEYYLPMGKKEEKAVKLKAPTIEERLKRLEKVTLSPLVKPKSPLPGPCRECQLRLRALKEQRRQLKELTKEIHRLIKERQHLRQRIVVQVHGQYKSAISDLAAEVLRQKLEIADLRGTRKEFGGLLPSPEGGVK